MNRAGYDDLILTMHSTGDDIIQARVIGYLWRSECCNTLDQFLNNGNGFLRLVACLAELTQQFSKGTRQFWKLAWSKDNQRNKHYHDNMQRLQSKHSLTFLLLSQVTCTHEYCITFHSGWITKVWL